jgi:histidinol phosphatase-like enzyme
MSSVGQLQGPFIKEFRESIGGDFRLVWPTYSDAIDKIGKEHMFLSERNASAAIEFMTPLKRFPGRMHSLNHSKILIASDWCYIGSANMSISAWGRSVYEGTAFSISSFELGIHIRRPVFQEEDVSDYSRQGIEVCVPFIKNPPETLDEPWILQKYRKIILSEKEDSLYAFFNRHRSSTRPFAIVFIQEQGLDTQEPSDDYVKVTLIPELEKFANTYIVNLACNSRTSYQEHLESFFRIHRYPTILILNPGSRFEGDLAIVAKLDTTEQILTTDVSDLFNEFGQSVKVPHCPAVQYMVDNEIQLVCLDVDGTLVESNTSSNLLPSARAFLFELSQINPKIQFALVTNQGAVGLRYWMETAKFGDPSSLPTKEAIDLRLATIKSQVEQLVNKNISLFAAFRYQSKSGRWGPVPNHFKNMPEWSQEWRKPNPGMIREAMKFAGISPFMGKTVLMIGDMDSDEGAAKSAGVRFLKAPNCFTDKGT